MASDLTFEFDGDAADMKRELQEVKREIKGVGVEGDKAGQKGKKSMSAMNKTGMDGAKMLKTAFVGLSSILGGLSIGALVSEIKKAHNELLGLDRDLSSTIMLLSDPALAKKVLPLAERLGAELRIDPRKLKGALFTGFSLAAKMAEEKPAEFENMIKSAAVIGRQEGADPQQVLKAIMKTKEFFPKERASRIGALLQEAAHQSELTMDDFASTWARVVSAGGMKGMGLEQMAETFSRGSKVMESAERLSTAQRTIYARLAAPEPAGLEILKARGLEKAAAPGRLEGLLRGEPLTATQMKQLFGMEGMDLFGYMKKTVGERGELASQLGGITGREPMEKEVAMGRVPSISRIREDEAIDAAEKAIERRRAGRMADKYAGAQKAGVVAEQAAMETVTGEGFGGTEASAAAGPLGPLVAYNIAFIKNGLRIWEEIARNTRPMKKLDRGGEAGGLKGD